MKKISKRLIAVMMAVVASLATSVVAFAEALERLKESIDNYYDN